MKNEDYLHIQMMVLFTTAGGKSACLQFQIAGLQYLGPTFPDDQLQSKFYQNRQDVC